MARDLKADLAKLETLVQEINEYANLHNYLGQKQNTVRSPFKIVFEEMEELANLAAEAGEEWLRQALAEKERSEQLESLVRELVYSLKLIRGSSQFSRTTWEEITDLANIALIGAEEVLGDDALRVR